MRSRAKLKSSNLPYDNAYCHQTCKDGDIPPGALNQKVMMLWSRGLVRSRNKLNTFMKHCDHRVSENVPSIMAQSWP